MAPKGPGYSLTGRKYQWEQKMSDDVALPLEFTEAAANKVKNT